MLLLMSHSSQSETLTGLPKELSLVSKIKDNADHAGPSQQLVALKVSIGFNIRVKDLSLSSN